MKLQADMPVRDKLSFFVYIYLDAMKRNSVMKQVAVAMGCMCLCCRVAVAQPGAMGDGDAALMAETGGSGDAADVEYVIDPADVRQVHEGWGVSLAWWANMCGKWSNANIDKLIDWLVSPAGLNYNVFRYNIGGGDDPENRNCTAHHMADGKGVRAEMEGFKDSTDGEYIWSRDAAQRKIMLKIKEKRPDAIFEAFSNSAPYYMTKSGCVAGNASAFSDNLGEEYYEEFAHYLVDVCKHYKDEYGVEFRTLEPFNESASWFWKRNGDQEGCHFDYGSQIAFIKVLYPILQASGLNTVIAASDENKVSESVNGLKKYRDAGVLDMVGQWNTHTYSATDAKRAELRELARENGLRLWMSETGASGDGIKGNIAMAQRLFDDVRNLECVSWHDWQYVEEGNDQWCMVSGNFKDQTFSRNKNYYVRQQVTRYIKPGYRFVATPEKSTLAAVNEARDTMVVVALNNTENSVRHVCAIKNCDVSGVRAMNLTSATANMGKSTCSFDGGKATFSLPKYSIATFVVPLNRDDSGVDAAVSADVEIAAGNGRIEVASPDGEQGRVAVYAVNGVCVADVGFTSGATVRLAPGFYIVNVTTGRGCVSRKVSVN